MAKVEFGKIIDIEAIKEILERELGPDFKIKINKNRIVIVQDATKACVIWLKEKNGVTICKGPRGFIPSIGPGLPYSLAIIALFTFLYWNMGFLGFLVGLLPATVILISMSTPSLKLVNNVKGIIRQQAAQGEKQGEYKQQGLDEELITQITKNFVLKSSPELEGILNNQDTSQYSYEAFESIKRILSTREKNLLKETKEILQSGESSEEIIRTKKQEEMSAYIQESLEDRFNRKEEVENLLYSFRSKRKILMIAGVCFSLLISTIAVYLRDLEFFFFYIAVLFLICGLPFMHYSKKSKAHTRILEKLDKDIADISVARKQKPDP